MSDPTPTPVPFDKDDFTPFPSTVNDDDKPSKVVVAHSVSRKFFLDLSNQQEDETKVSTVLLVVYPAPSFYRAF